MAVEKEAGAHELFQLTIRIRAHDTNRSNILESLRRLQGPTGSRRGCRRMGVYGAVDDSDEIVLIEEWEGREMLDAYLRSKDFGVVLSIIDLSESEPVVRVDTILAREGLQQFSEIQAG